MQPALSTTANSGFPAGAKRADDMTPEAWTGLIGGLMEFLGEEAREPEHAADAQPQGAGVAFVTPEGKALFLKRSAAGDHPNEYCLPGGGVEAGENAVAAARREGAEETGHPTDGRLMPIDRRSTGGVDFATFAHPVDGEFEPRLNGEHTSHVWAPLDDPPRPLHPGVEATLGGGTAGEDWMPVWGGKKSPFDSGTSPEVGLDDEYRRDAKGEFAGEGEVSGSSTTARERSDWGGRTSGGEHEGSGWSAQELADYADEKPEGIDAGFEEGKHPRDPKGEFTSGAGEQHRGSGPPTPENPMSPQEWKAYTERKKGPLGKRIRRFLRNTVSDDASREVEHTATIKFNGDFDMAGLLRHLHHLGAIGASRGVDAIDADDKPVHFGWDGDGADKIVEAEVDGEDVLAADEAVDGVEVDDEHDGPWMSCMSKDRRTMYRNKNVPPDAEIDGELVPVDPLLVRHEKAEVEELERLLAEFKEQNGREPGDEERKAIYLKAHKTKGTPAERAYAEQTHGPGFWEKWSAWCRGIEAELEKGPFANEPDDADVKPIPHGHGDLEAEDVAMDSMLRLLLALDRDSVREYDDDGHLHVKGSTISKAVVSPYKGEEVPGWEELGLDPNRIYQLLRDPEELEKAAPSFHGKPLLLEHAPTDAKDHQTDLVIGAVYNPYFEYPDLKAELVVWPESAIKSIEDKTKCEISCGYRYVADMTPGNFEGKPFQGRMTAIGGNHVTLCVDGRVPGAVVADSSEELNWSLVENLLLSLPSSDSRESIPQE